MALRWKNLTLRVLGLGLALLLIFPLTLCPPPNSAQASAEPGGTWNYLVATPTALYNGQIVRFEFSFTTNVLVGAASLLFTPNPAIGPDQPLQYLSSSPPADPGAGQYPLVWPSDWKPAGTVLQGYAEFRLNGAQAGSTINVQASFTLEGLHNTYYPERTFTLFVQSSPQGQLSIQLEPNVSTVEAGGNLTYQIFVSNPTSQTAQNVRITDYFDDQALYPLIGSIGGPIVVGNSVIWDLYQPIPAYGSVNLSISFGVWPDVDLGYIIRNNASAAASGFSPVMAYSASVTVSGYQPGLYSLTMDVNQTQVAPGGSLRYTITFVNWTNTPLYQPLFQVTLPSSLQFLGVSSGGVVNGNTVQWWTSTIYYYQTVQLTMDVQVAPGVAQGTLIQNGVSFSARTGQGPYLVQLRAAAPSVTVAGPSFLLQQTFTPSPAGAGEQVRFTFQYLNQTNSNYKRGQLVCTLDPNLGQVNWEQSAPNSVSGNVYTFNLGEISGLQSGSLSGSAVINSSVLPGTILTNSAVLTVGGMQFSSSASLLVGPAKPPTPSAFPDVPSFYWAYNPIMAMVQEGILAGFPDGYFRPNEPVTRAQFAKMILLSMGLAPADSAQPSYPDLSTGDAWAYGYIQAARDYGLMTGYVDGTFKPNAPVTIAEVLTVIVRAQKWPLLDPPQPPPQILVHDTEGSGPPNWVVRPLALATCWFYPYAGTALARHILLLPDVPDIMAQGPNPYTYVVYFNSPASRAQASVFLYRMLSGQP